MPNDLSGEITAVATVVLAAFAIVTAVFAMLAFRMQSQEVRAIERQVKDQEVLTRQQAELLIIQSDQLKLQRQQLDDQHAEQRRAQATRILISAEPRPDPDTSAGEPIRETFVTVTNTSPQPIYDLRFLFREEDGEWTQLRGSARERTGPPAGRPVPVSLLHQPSVHKFPNGPVLDRGRRRFPRC